MSVPAAIFRPLVLNRVKEARLAQDAGPFRVGVVVHRDCIVLLWRVGRQRYWQVLRRVWFKSSAWVLCPTCGRKTWRLFAPVGKHFACRECAGVTYGYWAQDGRYRQPRKPATWLKWLGRRAKRVLKGGV